jgi:hypothetical protein
MKTRRLSIPRLFVISFLTLVFAATMLGQSQPQTQAKTQAESKAETKAQTRTGTQAQTKAGTRAQTKAGTQTQVKTGTSAAIRAGTRADTSQPTRQTGKAIPEKIEKLEKQTLKNVSHPGRCQAITKEGTRCTRRALTGSKYCRLHSRI